MIDRVVASRYARALFNIASAAKSTEIVLKDLEAVDRALGMDPKIPRMLSHPSLPFAVRREILDSMVSLTSRARLGALAGDFMALVMRRKRLGEFRQMLKDYSRLYDESRGVARARVKSAAAITPASVKELEKALSGISGKKVKAHAEVDAGLLGGLWVSMGGRVYDGTIRGRLKSMREQMAVQV